MEKFSKYIIGAAILGLIGIPLFIIDFNDLTWETNKEVYWGVISLIAVIGAVIFDNRSRKLIKEMENDKKINIRNNN